MNMGFVEARDIFISATLLAIKPTIDMYKDEIKRAMR
jgi:hypothetical protein